MPGAVRFGPAATPVVATAVALLAGACASDPDDYLALREMPSADDYCSVAQRVVTRTGIGMELVVHDSFESFVKSKAVIDGPNGPQIHQYNWTDDELGLVGISCKLKSADHLNLEFGDGVAGPDGACQDMNRAVFSIVTGRVRDPHYKSVSFDAAETVSNEEQPGMTGPDWLAPYEMTREDDEGGLHIRAKGFVVDFTDPRYSAAPARFRGVHYCHFVAPAYFEALMRGEAPAGVVVGREVDRSGPPPATGG